MKAKRPLFTIISINLLLIFLLAGFVLAAGGNLPRTLVSSGGGLIQQNDISLQHSIGQPIAGAVSNNLTLCSGFHCGQGVISLEENYPLYLPLITQ